MMKLYYNIIIILATIVAGMTCVSVIANKKYNK